MRARQTGYHINVYPDDSPSPFRKQACSMLRARQTGYHINVYPDDSPSHIKITPPSNEVFVVPIYNSASVSIRIWSFISYIRKRSSSYSYTRKNLSLKRTGRLSENSFRKIRFPILGRILSGEGVDVGASTTESDEILAKVGAGDCVEWVFGQSAEDNYSLCVTYEVCFHSVLHFVLLFVRGWSVTGAEWLHRDSCHLQFRSIKTPPWKVNRISLHFPKVSHFLDNPSTPCYIILTKWDQCFRF